MDKEKELVAEFATKLVAAFHDNGIGFYGAMRVLAYVQVAVAESLCIDDDETGLRG